MGTDLTIYGNRPEVKELGERVKRFLPGGANMTAEEALGFAQISIAQNLNPFAREIWYIPGIGTVTGIEGYRKMAKRQAYYSAQTREMTPEEREAHQLNDGDIGAICELYRPDVIMAAVKVNEAAGKIVIPIKPVIGTGIRRAGEKRTPKGRSALWVAEKRAEADALRKAFDLGIGYDDNGTMAVPGEIEELPGWAVAEADTDEDPEAVLARNRMLLHGDDETDAGPPPTEEPEAEAENNEAPRPYSPTQIRQRLRNNSKWVKGKADDFSDAKRQPDDKQEPPHPKLVQRLAALMSKALQRPEGGKTDLERHSVLGYLFGVDSTSLLTDLEARAAVKWLEAPAGEDGKPSWLPSGVASEECRSVLREAMKGAGQQELEMPEAASE